MVNCLLVSPVILNLDQIMDKLQNITIDTCCLKFYGHLSFEHSLAYNSGQIAMKFQSNVYINNIFD